MLIAIAALSVASGSANAAFPGADGRIAYGVWATPDKVQQEIYTIRINGSGDRMLPLPGRVGGPAWSPDGRMLAFSRFYYGGIWTARANGTSASEVIPVREPWLWAENPAWAPDGRQLAFNARWQEPGTGEAEGASHTTIYVADADGVQHALREGSQAEWSPDGRHIAYVGGHDRSIKIMRPDGSDPKILVQKARSPYHLDFSPDGRLLLFRERHEVARVSSYRLRVVRLNGGDVTTLPVTGNPLAAAWSPSGKRIAYLWEPYWRAGEGAPATQIWTMRKNGSGQRLRLELTDHRWAGSIAWQPRP